MSDVRPDSDSPARRVEVEAIVATDQPMDAYGGVQLDETVLRDLAEALRSGSLPMLIGHDIRRRLHPTVLDVKVRQRSDGYKEVWLRFSVNAEDWEQFERERVTSRAPGGFSFSCSELIAVVPAVSAESMASIKLNADASHWSDKDLLAAAEDLRAIGTVSVERRYQFSLEPAAIVALTVVVAPVLTGLVTNTIYDGLKRFLRRDRRTTFHFQVKRGDGSQVDALLETDDRKALRSAIDAFDRLVNPEQLYEWDESESNWNPLSGRSGAGQPPLAEPPTEFSDTT